MELKIKGGAAETISENANKLGMGPEEYLEHVLAKTQKKGRKIENLPVKAKAEMGKICASYAFQTFKNPTVIWSGGKDSTLVMEFVKKANDELGRNEINAILIEHFMHYDETYKFLNKMADDWGIKWAGHGVKELEDYKYNEDIVVEELPERLREELRKVGYNNPTFKFALNNIAANHLLKTVALNDAIKKLKIDAAFVGIRWDENPARAGETFFSPRENPSHFRIHPILLFTERELWEYTLRNNLPIHPLYKQGYRSLDDKYESKKTSDKPAWEQDFEKTPERYGRAQDKENIMERLRKFGYM